MRRMSRLGGSFRPPAPAGGPSPTIANSHPNFGIVEVRKGNSLRPPDGVERGVYCLRHGIVGLRRDNFSGRNVFLYLLYPGDVFCVSRGGTIAQAITPVRATLMGGADADGGFYGITGDRDWLLAALLREVELSEQRIVDLATLSAREILARHLLDFSRMHRCGGQEQTGAFRIPMSRQDLAAFMGIRPESLTSLLKWFIDRGLIALTRRQASILDFTAIQNIAGTHEAYRKDFAQKLTSVIVTTQ